MNLITLILRKAAVRNLKKDDASAIASARFSSVIITTIHRSALLTVTSKEK